jgi:hypothetical protein
MWLFLIKCSLYDFYNIKIKKICSALLVELTSVNKMHGTYIKICSVHCITGIGGLIPLVICFLS